MLDCSRNAVFTVEKVKAMIRILAKLGLNRLLLYTEDTYEVPELPYFDPNFTGEYPEEAPFTISELEEIYPAASGKSKVDEAFKEREKKFLTDSDSCPDPWSVFFCPGEC
mgnify:CR=1 FL=1